MVVRQEMPSVVILATSQLDEGSRLVCNKKTSYLDSNGNIPSTCFVCEVIV